MVRRVRSLVIRPAWTRLWICREPRGHMQAVGFDEKGRTLDDYPYLRHSRDSMFQNLVWWGEALKSARERDTEALAA